MTGPVGGAASTWTFLRSFLIQGSWNYHTMLGSGFAFAMLPALRDLHRDDPDALDAAVRRHLEHFNAHPYLSDLALGAAVRGPLGSIGDSLVWAAWLPAVSLAALALFWLGVPGGLSALFFVLVYNVGHIGLRVWGFRVGLTEGHAVASRLARVRFGVWTDRIRGGAALLLGVVAGAVLAGDQGLWAAGPPWAGVGAFTFGTGLIMGQRAWRPAAAAVVAAVVAIAIWGIR